MIRLILFILSIIVISCNKSTPTTAPDENSETSSGTTYNLETCTTDIATDVPEFFQKYFHCVKARMSESGNYVNIYYNGKPPFESWYYSSSHANHIEWYTQGTGYFQIPNAYIQEVDYVISIPVNPQPIDGATKEANAVDGIVGNDANEYPMGSVGCALDGVNIFNPLAAPGDVIEDEAYTFDLYSGHPAGPSGIYHYHTTSKGPLEVLKKKLPNVVTQITPGSAEIELYGIMCDGVVVMGCKELNGNSPNKSDWDAQNGHIHNIIDENGAVLFENRYHTHICYDIITEEDTDGNGYQEHEFTPESSYYISNGTGNNNVCGAMSSPIEPDR